MKGFFVAGIAFSALVGVATASEQEEPKEGGNPLDHITALLENADTIPWGNFSPGSLGINLNFDEMSEEKLKSIAEGFTNLGLIPLEEQEQFMAALQDPRMRLQMKKMSENWPEVMKNLLADPSFLDFFKQFGTNPDLAKLVGLDPEKIASAMGENSE